jgi:two-component system chemotaxis response regulator CheB
MERKKIRVLVVDDSVLARKYISDIIIEDPDMELVGTAYSGEKALQKINKFKPDVVTLDILMPDMDGLETLKKIMNKCPTRIIIVSSATRRNEFATLLAMEMGAVDFVSKPEGASDRISIIKNQIKSKIKKAMAVNVGTLSKDVITDNKPKPQTIAKIKSPQTYNLKTILGEKAPNKGIITEKIIAIGCSTGGPNALKEMFTNPRIDTTAAYLIVQHMPKPFTTIFADRLNTFSKINIKEAEDGDIVYAGMGYIAPGDAHLTVLKKAGVPIIRLTRYGKVSGHMPSIDALFESLSNNMVKKTIAVIMTGMGDDGARGITMLKKKGAVTIAQDKATSVVYGMNQEAVKTGDIDYEVPLQNIVDLINQHLKTPSG